MNQQQKPIRCTYLQITTKLWNQIQPPTMFAYHKCKEKRRATAKINVDVEHNFMTSGRSKLLFLFVNVIILPFGYCPRL